VFQGEDESNGVRTGPASASARYVAALVDVRIDDRFAGRARAAGIFRSRLLEHRHLA